MSSSLIPPESLARVGEVLSEPVTVRIDRREAQRYAYAVGDVNPIYFDVDLAHAAGYRSLTVPPLFITHALVRPEPAQKLRPDGLYEDSTTVTLKVSRMMFGGEEWDFLEPVCVGDEITGTTRLADLDQKDGKKGPFVRLVRETTFTNQDGQIVARSRQIGIAR
ncbi:MAG: MaoC family dehydratase N-terminal domain-containing protein [Actinomycetota bacterium]|nr:hypothetical protein [Acidimicrobiaceae bacterium]MEC7915700.1 MaoC family dehydratase N-terminal domain-containing protein [Actinomycetota bacterium]MEC9473988.1 MaoC family dehydratase N-terminal domain-containing protein [Actinomycetota bacterium]MEE3257542.1 MaoC family dehydratase N-terminal domain-containing protein [Actinomycetota bacterium]